MEKSVLLDLANETVRRYGALPPDFVEKMAKRIKRKFSVKVEHQEIYWFVLHCKEIYDFGKSVFREYLKPPKGKYADPSNIDGEKFLNRLIEKFPNDNVEILTKISGWVIYYEYLR